MLEFSHKHTIYLHIYNLKDLILDTICWKKGLELVSYFLCKLLSRQELILTWEICSKLHLRPFLRVHLTYFSLRRQIFRSSLILVFKTTKVKTTYTFILKMKNDKCAGSKTHWNFAFSIHTSSLCLYRSECVYVYAQTHTQRTLEPGSFYQPRSLRLSVSRQSGPGRVDPDWPLVSPFLPSDQLWSPGFRNCRLGQPAKSSPSPSLRNAVWTY